jgi:hypothetical protein
MTTQKSREEILAGMDAASLDARKEYIEMKNKLDPGTMYQLKSWWMRHFPKAGHKRLANILMNE